MATIAAWHLRVDRAFIPESPRRESLSRKGRGCSQCAATMMDGASPKPQSIMVWGMENVGLRSISCSNLNGAAILQPVLPNYIFCSKLCSDLGNILARANQTHRSGLGSSYCQNSSGKFATQRFNINRLEGVILGGAITASHTFRHSHRIFSFDIWNLVDECWC